MKSAKRILSFLLFVIMVFTLSACKNKSENTIIGKWTVSEENILQMTGLTKEEFEQFKQMGVEQTATWEFSPEGIVTITMDVSGQYVRDFLPYEVKDGKIYMEGDVADYKISGKTLTITQEDVRLTMTKTEE